MAQEVEVSLPKLGESILNATVVQWFKKEGDSVALDEPLLEVATDKVNSEIPSPVAGVLTKILALPDQELAVGDPLARIAVGAVPEKLVATKPLPCPLASAPESKTSSEAEAFLSPAVLRMAQEKGISLADLQKINGTGEGGRVTKKDIELHLAAKPLPPKMPSPIHQGDVERIKMSPMRKAIAENMVRSFYQAPHATLIAEVDVTKVLRYIKKEKENYLAKYGVKLTITAFLARAIAKALGQYPHLNATLEGDTIVVKHFVNLGIAVSVDHGLFVPVIHNCHTLELPALSQAIQSISKRAREGNLTTADLASGTISLTNFGMSGILMGTPIIRFPEVAIIGLGAIHEKVIPLEEEGSFAIRSVVNISLSFDHRVVDGMYSCGFLGALKQHLEHDI